ncbi:MAG: acyl-CoA dehydrogenase domain-containing protein [Promethearchaeota archaeon CR_4]|nr:MAG: acyl-CoA dehydrogenase domain-containing protein [Candidatus Lokiarchaeota archaeon CR_4]
MPKEYTNPDFITYEDLGVQLGESMFPGSHFLYTEEERTFRLNFRKFLLDNIASLAPQIEREYNWDICYEAYQRLARAGYLKFSFPTSIGGHGKGFVYRTIFGEELGAINSAVTVTYGASANLFAAPIIHFGTEDQKKKYLTKIMSGEALGAIGITEPSAGSDAVGGMKTTAIKTASGNSYILNGEKRFITNGSKADYILVYALTNPNAPKKNQGISAFIFPTNTPGFERVKEFELVGRRGSINSYLRFNNCEVPAENLVGGPAMENKGIKIMMTGLDGERCFTCSQYIGVARFAFEIATRYANRRVQFGKKIQEFEGIGFKISEMYAKLEASRLMMLRAARMLDAGQTATKEVAAAKFTAATSQMEIVVDAMQIVGGISYTKEYPLEQLYRDAKIAQMAAGTVEILKFLCEREIYSSLKLDKAEGKTKNDPKP